MFENPIARKKVRKNLYAYKYINGCINIDGIKYFDYSLTAAINAHRKKYPINNKLKSF
jgi:hypothetical protein